MEGKEFKEVLTSIVDNMFDEHATKNEELTASLIKMADEGAEHFNLFVCNDKEMTISAAIRKKFETSPNKDKLAFLYTHYNFLDSHIKEYLRDTAGDACCADRSRYILKGYHNYLLTGEMFDTQKDEYYVCPFGTSQEWIDFVVAVHYMYYRFPNEKQKEAFNKMDAKVKLFQEAREAEEAAFLKRIETSYIDYENIVENDIAVIIENQEDGRFFCQLYDVFCKDIHFASLRKFYTYFGKLPCIIRINKGEILISKAEGWLGKIPVKLKDIERKG